MTVEFVLWMPLMFALLALIADVSLIFYGQSVAVRVVQDANRAYSLGRIADSSALEQQILTTLRQRSPNMRVASTVSNGIVTTEVMMPARDLDAVGWFSAISQLDVAVRSQQVIE